MWWQTSSSTARFQFARWHLSYPSHPRPETGLGECRLSAACGDGWRPCRTEVRRLTRRAPDGPGGGLCGAGVSRGGHPVRGPARQASARASGHPSRSTPTRRRGSHTTARHHRRQRRDRHRACGCGRSRPCHPRPATHHTSQPCSAPPTWQGRCAAASTAPRPKRHTEGPERRRRRRPAHRHGPAGVLEGAVLGGPPIEVSLYDRRPTVSHEVLPRLRAAGHGDERPGRPWPQRQTRPVT